MTPDARGTCPGIRGGGHQRLAVRHGSGQQRNADWPHAMPANRLEVVQERLGEVHCVENNPDAKRGGPTLYPYLAVSVQNPRPFSRPFLSFSLLSSSFFLIRSSSS